MKRLKLGSEVDRSRAQGADTKTDQGDNKLDTPMQCQKETRQTAPEIYTYKLYTYKLYE